MQTFQKIIERQNINTVKVVSPLSGINTRHLSYVDIVMDAQWPHRTLQSPVPSFSQLYFQTYNMGFGSTLAFAGFNDKINFAAACRAIKKYRPVTALPFFRQINPYARRWEFSKCYPDLSISSHGSDNIMGFFIPLYDDAALYSKLKTWSCGPGQRWSALP